MIIFQSLVRFTVKIIKCGKKLAKFAGTWNPGFYVPISPLVESEEEEEEEAKNAKMELGKWWIYSF